MKVRRSHYELAFEAYLDRRGTPYVSVEDVRNMVKGRTGAKAFDYVVYPAAGPACLVDVKGRKFPQRSDNGDCRQKNWVTRSDVDGLLTWQGLFGEGYESVFVFAYWLAEPDGMPPPLFEDDDVLRFSGRRYRFWLAPVGEYSKHYKRISKSWDTVCIPRDEFLKLSRSLETVWPAAPC